jgi:hypothetical protein
VLTWCDPSVPPRDAKPLAYATAGVSNVGLRAADEGVVAHMTMVPGSCTRLPGVGTGTHDRRSDRRGRKTQRRPRGRQSETFNPRKEGAMPYDEEPCSAGCKGCSYCSDAYGVDAIKDANVEAGRDPYDPAGWGDAKANGWTRGPNY